MNLHWNGIVEVVGRLQSVNLGVLRDAQLGKLKFHCAHFNGVRGTLLYCGMQRERERERMTQGGYGR